MSRHAMNAAAFALMIEELQTGTSAADLVEATGVRVNTAEKYIRALRNRGLLRVIDWQIDARGIYSRRVFALQTGRDVPRPVGKRQRVASVFQLARAA